MRAAAELHMALRQSRGGANSVMLLMVLIRLMTPSFLNVTDFQLFICCLRYDDGAIVA